MPSPTITTIRSLQGVGILADCSPSTFGHVFRRHNLIYGFNGSGKTTLSRLIDSLSEKGISGRLEPAAKFCFELSDGTKPDSANPNSNASRFIAVFNEDYVERSLAWAHGTAEAIIYVGEEQAEIAAELAKLEANEIDQSARETLAGSEFSSKEKELSNLARDVARLISEEAGFGRNYNAANLKADFDADTYGPDDTQSDLVRVGLRQTINQTEIPAKIDVQLGLVEATEFVRKAGACLETSLARLTIESLDRRQDALNWVREGIHIHSDEIDCLFCGNSIPEGRIAGLSSALGEGFEQLKQSGSDALAAINDFGNKCRNGRDLLADVGETLPSHTSTIGTTRSTLAHIYAEGEAAASEIAAQVRQKLSNPELMSGGSAFDPVEWNKEVAEALRQFGTAVADNNRDIDDFAAQKASAKTTLKRHHLAHYDNAYRDLVTVVAQNKFRYEAASETVRATRRKIADARGKLRTHCPAAATINEILAGYLGHKEIQLVANDEGYQLLRRGSTDHKPLSEGEKTAIAFSHFLATLHSDGRCPQDFVVVLDDPISSLDARAMTHAVALIQQRFGEPLQLFVLTHNLDFMREMKKWLHKKYENELAEFLFIQTSMETGGRTSKIVKMPKLIREYESEYHYLYSLVKLLAEKPSEAEFFAYLMPNAIRKVLDIFLAFKQPGSSGLSSKVDKMIKDTPALDPAKVKAMERLVHLESHSESIGDTTTFSAHTLEQLSDAAKCMMEIIDQLDSEHKSAMDKLCR